MKIVITGGHITPALAVIEAFPKDAEIVFIGRKHAFEKDTSPSFEFQEITKRGITFYDLKTGRLQRKFSHHGITSLAKIPQGFFASYNILKKEKPDVILSFGGYIGLPVVYAGFTLGIPSVIHEQTMEAGFSNKLAGKIATKICISWQQSEIFFPKNKTVLTGNPLRIEILETLDKKQVSHTLPIVYVTGGSAGSHEVNLLIKNHLEEMLEFCEVVHQTGDAKLFNDFSELSALKATLPEKKKKRYTPVKFLSSSSAAMHFALSDLVVGRSGINTVSELLYLKKKSLLIPLLVGQKGEQMTNARFLKAEGLSEIYDYKMNFTETVKKMIDSEDYKLKHPFNNSLFTSAADKIVRLTYETTKKT